MKKIVSLLLGCIFLVSIGNTMDNLNSINNCENNKLHLSSLIKLDYKDNINTSEIKSNKTIDNLLNNKKLLMICSINKKILTEDANKMCNKFNINYDILSEYKQYWRQLEYYIKRINKEIKSNSNKIINTFSLNEMSNTLLLNGKLSLIASDIKFKIEKKLKLCENNNIEFLKMINSEHDLYSTCILKVIYSLADEIPSLILYCQSLYSDAFAAKKVPDECCEQLDNICKLLGL